VSLDSTLTIRPYRPDDWPHVWAALEPVFRAGETYSFVRDISEDEAKGVWTDPPRQTWVAFDTSGTLLGTYYIKPNQPGQGAHICNCGYVVSPSARGRGLASKLCEHSQVIAKSLSFHGMQYNLVVSTNEVAVYVWKKMGFEIVGTIPEAFDHPRLGLVDCFVMYKKLG